MSDCLEAQFHEQMVNIYRNALTQAHYEATKFHAMVTAQGGLAAAMSLLHTLDLPPFLRQTVKTQNPLNGELSHGIVS